MELEWDDAKRAKTLADRGLDFADLSGFDWASAETRRDDRRDYGEIRMWAFGPLNGRPVRVTFTDRGDRRRIISLHRVSEDRG